MAKSAVIFSLIFGILVVGFGAFFAKDRIESFRNSDTYAATVVECKHGRRRSADHNHRSTSFYTPIAVSEEGFRAVGRLKVSSKSMCHNLIGHEVTIFVDRNDAEKTRIYSFSQFWLAPFILLSAIGFGVANLVKRKLVSLVVFIGAFGIGGTALALEYKAFHDPLDLPNLQPVNQEKAARSCIDYALRNKNFEDANQLKELTCKRRGLTDLTQFARLRSLEKLDLTLNQITSVKRLKSLTRLRELNLDGNRNLQSLEGLSELYDLEILKVHCAGLQNIDAVSSLTKLRHLDVSCNEISSLAPITNLKALEKLIMDGNPNITSLAPVANKPALEVITLYRVPTSDISPLFGNTNLRRANIGSNAGIPCSQIEELRSRLGKNARVSRPKDCIES